MEFTFKKWNFNLKGNFTFKKWNFGESKFTFKKWNLHLHLKNGILH